MKPTFDSLCFKWVFGFLTWQLATFDFNQRTMASKKVDQVGLPR